MLQYQTYSKTKQCHYVYETPEKLTKSQSSYRFENYPKRINFRIDLTECFKYFREIKMGIMALHNKQASILRVPKKRNTTAKL